MFLTKYSASGNDFLITTAFRGANRANLARQLCDRHNGVGADGFVVLLPHAKFSYCWEFYNADGSKADMCGNASRCVAHYAVAHKIAPKNHSFLSGAGAIKVRVARNIVEVNLGKVRILKENIVEFMPNYLKNNNSNSSIVSEKSGLRSCERENRTNGSLTKRTTSLPDLSPQDEFGLNFALLDSGVPHLVAFVDSFAKENIAKNLAFLKTLRDKYNANVNIATITGKNTIELLTFERGVENITLACGTGMCAVYFLAKSQNLISDIATLIPPSGDKIALRLENDEVCFKGKVTKIADLII
ncbi:diaminopimelate epimerase [Helicobacter sp. 23-1045]